MTNRRWLIGGTSAMVAAGLAGGAVLASVSSANASNRSVRVVNAASAGASGADLLAESSTTTTTPTNGAAPAAPARGQRIDSVIDKLVTDGVINADQATKIKDALKAALPQGGAGRGDFGGRGGPGGPGFGTDGRGGFGFLADAGKTVADAIGITADQLRTELTAGKSIKDVAEAHGKTAQNVIDALTAAAKTRFAQAVTDGKLTQAQADDALARATQAIPNFVNNARPAFAGGGRGHRGGTPAPNGAATTTTTVN